MPMPVTCTCGAHFEIAETLMGQEVGCPECRQPVRASPFRKSIPTSGFALASTMLALLLAFTGVGTVVAVLLGIVGLISIARNPGKVAGTGYAVFGIVAGLGFTGLFLFIIVGGDPALNRLSARLRGQDIDWDGPIEVTGPRRDYAITRPSASWGKVKSSAGISSLVPDHELMLANVSKRAYITVENAFLSDSLDQFARTRYSDYSTGRLIKSKHLGTSRGMESMELLVDNWTDDGQCQQLIRLNRPVDSDRVYVVTGWTRLRSFPRMEGEIRRGVESFRLLPR